MDVSEHAVIGLGDTTVLAAQHSSWVVYRQQRDKHKLLTFRFSTRCKRSMILEALGVALAAAVEEEAACCMPAPSVLAAMSVDQVLTRQARGGHARERYK